ncbi:MAG TPA: monovalent cation/H(+) antiporter subunit G [Streptosporangiaceae bacterium]|nr:monovalent cation/H(+) antiporter subunit G [Streptosporangiaceae bacterium]
MSGREILADCLLGLAVAIVLASSIGILVMRDTYRKLHYVTPAALVGPFIVGLAVLAQSGLTLDTAETGLALVFIMIASPFLSHATIRAARIREKGDWRLRAGHGKSSADSPVEDRP